MKSRMRFLVLAAAAFPLGLATATQSADLIEAARQSGQFGRLLEAIDAAGLTETLQEPGPYTVFAPTDSAFERLPEGASQALLDEQNRNQLTALLKHHVIAGEAISSDSIPKTLEPMASGPIRVTATDGKVTLRSDGAAAEIVEGDIEADNGIIHALGSVLAPAGMLPGPLLAGIPGSSVELTQALTEQRELPFEGALEPSRPPERPLPEGQKPVEDWVKQAMRVLYQRPMPEGPEPITLEQTEAISIIGKGPVIQALPGPPVFPDKAPAHVQTALPEEVPFSNNVVQLPAGEIRAVAIDRTLNDSKLSEDRMEIQATFTDHEGSEWKIVQLLLAPLSPNPVAEPWYGGLVIGTRYHGQTGNGTPLVPLVECALCSWGWADVWKDGKKVGSAVPLHMMLTSDTRDDQENFKYACYDCADNPVREIHLVVAPEAGLPSPGGFLHVMWEDAEVRRGSPEELQSDLQELALDIPTIELNAVEALRWSRQEIEVPVGQPVRLVLDNQDPIAAHAFMVHTAEGHVHVPLPHGSAWATTIVFDQPGIYEFRCPVGNHAKRGMRGRFRAIVQEQETAVTPATPRR